MRDLVDTIFSPLLNWLGSIKQHLANLSVPLARPFDVDRYFGYFSILGPYWTFAISTICALAVLYGLTYVIVANIGLVRKFKDLIKWW